MIPGFPGFSDFFQGIQENLNLQSMDILCDGCVGTAGKNPKNLRNLGRSLKNDTQAAFLRYFTTTNG